jgi:hypothetical protein
MAKKTTTSRAAVIVDRRPQQSVVIQMHYRTRSANGKFIERGSRSLTVQNITLNEAESRIRKTFSE